MFKFNPNALATFYSNAKLHLLLYNFLPIKSSKYLTIYFGTLLKMSPSSCGCQMPLSLFLIKYSLYSKIVLFFLNYTCNLSPHLRLYLFDYFHLVSIEPVFNLIFGYIFLSTGFLIHLMYFTQFKSDYHLIPYQILVLKQTQNTFLDLEFQNKQNIQQFIGKIIFAFSVTLIVFDAVSCKYFFTEKLNVNILTVFEKNMLIYSQFLKIVNTITDLGLCQNKLILNPVNIFTKIKTVNVLTTY